NNTASSTSKFKSNFRCKSRKICKNSIIARCLELRAISLEGCLERTISSRMYLGYSDNIVVWCSNNNCNITRTKICKIMYYTTNNNYTALTIKNSVSFQV